MKTSVLAALIVIAISACSSRPWVMKSTVNGDAITVYPAYWNGHEHMILSNRTKGYSLTCYQSGDIKLYKKRANADFRDEYEPVADTAFRKEDGRRYLKTFGRNAAFTQDADLLKTALRIYLSDGEWALLKQAINYRNNEERKMDSNAKTRTHHLHILPVPDQRHILFFVRMPDVLMLQARDSTSQN